MNNRKSNSRLTTLSSIQPKQVEWLWDQRIPLGEISIIDGDPSTNKSSVTLDMAARVSTGRPMPDGTPGIHGGVLLLLAEDSLEKTIVQRLSAAEADLDRISTIKGNVSLPKDVSIVEQSICQTQAKLVLIDPLMAFLSCDANGDQKVRRALTPLKSIAEKTNCAVVMVRHLTKRGGKNSLYRGSGSIGVIAATRSAFLIGKSPDDPNFRVLCHLKNNLGPLAQSLMFEPINKNGIVGIEWRGECDYTPDEILAPSSPHDSKLGAAMSFLSNALSNGPVKQTIIKQQASNDGIALRTLERAKELMDVESKRQGFGPGSTYHWSLPTDDPPWSANVTDVADHELTVISTDQFEHT